MSGRTATLEILAWRDSKQKGGRTMNRRQWMMLYGAAVAARGRSAQAPQEPSTANPEQDTPDKFLLNDYRPESIFKVPKTEVKRAKYPVVDAHCHGPVAPQQVDDMVKLMDSVGVEKTVIFTGARTPERFKEVSQLYAPYPKRFDLWCSFDLSGVNDPGFGPNAVKALEECHRLGALGVGRSATKAGASVTAPDPGGRVEQVQPTARRAGIRVEEAASFRPAPNPLAPIPTIRVWTLFGTSAGGWECRSISTCRIRFGPTSRWTGPMTAS